MLVNGEQPLSVVRVGEIKSQENPQRWLVDGLWGASSVGVIGGAPKCAKTWLGLDMALSVATGNGATELAAKAGMHGFTKALALEVARKGVTVNTISPGYIGTQMVMAIPKEVLDSKIIPQIPVGRLGKPQEVAGLVAYLCSEEAAFVTGANIAINGGQHMQ